MELRIFSDKFRKGVQRQQYFLANQTILLFSLEALAFLTEEEVGGDEKIEVEKADGQHTFRWLRAMQAKENGMYEGRAILRPSEMLDKWKEIMK